MDFENHPLISWLRSVRRDFHMHPELGNMEFRTTKKIKEILGALGIELQELPSVETGAAGVFFGKSREKTIALRGDIDALPMTERNDVPYKSVNEGVMHSCGHDCHATIILGVAETLADSDAGKDLNGNVKFILQPAEETVNGAVAMIDAGVLKNPTVTRIIGIHMNSDIPVGRVGLYNDVSNAGADTFSLEIHGKGVHGAFPHEGIDPIVAGAYFVTGVQSIVARNIDPVDSAVITVGKFQAGTAPNIIPDRAVLTGTVRYFSKKVRMLIIERLEALALGLEKTFQVEVDYRFNDGVPVCITDPGVTEDLYTAAVKVLGEENVHYVTPQMGGEDFGQFMDRVPGTFMRIGCRNEEKGIIHKGHSPYFDVDETALAVGVEVLTQAVRSYLS
ncbi:MAG: amidohydrolase [Deltaproteobacteria bacterium]|nr:amidohydrolase [Deltaproteobacteria bacterium]